MMVNWGFNCATPPDLFFAQLVLRIMCPDHLISQLLEANSISFVSKVEVELNNNSKVNMNGFVPKFLNLTGQDKAEIDALKDLDTALKAL